jgi:hypothetical protein
MNICAGRPRRVPSATSYLPGKGGRASGAPISPDWSPALTIRDMSRNHSECRASAREIWTLSVLTRARSHLNLCLGHSCPTETAPPIWEQEGHSLASDNPRRHVRDIAEMTLPVSRVLVSHPGRP